MDDKKTLTILAAIAGHMNYGQPAPEPSTVRRLTTAKSVTLSSAVMMITGNIMETDEHEKMFMEEAEMWETTLGEMLPTEIAHHYPRIWGVYMAGMPQRFKDAALIQEGAVNPIGMARSLVAACKECLDEGVQQDTDPAVRLIVHQIAFICRVSEFDSPVAYSNALQVCRDKAG
jgi:hypothetical protein